MMPPPWDANLPAAVFVEAAQFGNRFGVAADAK
jgi:hypothetical protein